MTVRDAGDELIERLRQAADEAAMKPINHPESENYTGSAPPDRDQSSVAERLVFHPECFEHIRDTNLLRTVTIIPYASIQEIAFEYHKYGTAVAAFPSCARVMFNPSDTLVVTDDDALAAGEVAKLETAYRSYRAAMGQIFSYERDTAFEEIEDEERRKRNRKAVGNAIADQGPILF